MMKRTISFIVFIMFLLSVVIIPTSVFADEQPLTDIKEYRTEFAKHFNNYDGTITAYISPVPLHYYDNGEWIDIDNTLIEGEDGNFVNKDNPMHVTLSSAENFLNSSENEKNPMISLEYSGYRIEWDIISDEISNLGTTTLEIGSESITKYLTNENSYSKDELRETLIGSLTSTATYKSILPNTDLDVELSGNSVKESIVLTSNTDIPNNYTYRINAGGLQAVLNKDHSIVFRDEDETIFTIPAPFMFDQSESREMNYNIDVDLEQIDSEYLIRYTPDINWLKAESTVYPVIIDPTLILSRTECCFSFLYSSQSNPNSAYTNSITYVGNESNNQYTAYGSYSDSLNWLGNYGVIKSAKLYFSAYSNNSDAALQMSGVTEKPSSFIWPSSYTWNNRNLITAQSINTTTIPQNDAFYSYCIMDMTSLMQTWLNYENAGSSSYIGMQNLGFKLSVNSNNTVAIYTGTPLTELSYSLHFTYQIGSAYKMYYAPEKYNAIAFGISNFQNRMNCYAYALQVYYKEYLYNGSYNLLPGEIGRQDPSSQYYESSYTNLWNGYLYYDSLFSNQTTPSDRYAVCTPYMNFIQNQLFADANAMGFSITPYYFNGYTFNIDPNSGFDPDNERIIALVVYGVNNHKLDFHFYARGIETGGNGNKWTHKPGNTCVTDRHPKYNVLLNDNNINSIAYDIKDAFFTYNVVKYYRITQNTDVYSHWYGNGTVGTVTPYCQ